MAISVSPDLDVIIFLFIRGFVITPLQTVFQVGKKLKTPMMRIPIVNPHKIRRLDKSGKVPYKKISLNEVITIVTGFSI